MQTLIRKSLADAWRIVAAAPWNDLPETVRNAILERADESDGCAAVAAAHGRRDPSTSVISQKTAAAFFAALAPVVWDALDADAQQRWRHALWRDDVHLAVRSPGLRPEMLTHAPLNNLLARAVRRHARDTTALRAALPPVALHSPPITAAISLIAALLSPSDPGAFFVIAGGRSSDYRIMIIASALRTPGDLALAVALQRSADDGAPIHARCTALQRALCGRTWDDVPPILALLTDDARAALMPDDAALARRLAHPNRRNALRRTLDRLASLPPDVAVPTCVALMRCASRHVAAAAAAPADALRAHGDLFLAVTDAVTTDDLRPAPLPLPEDAALACALRALAQDDPPTAQRLARAMRDRSWRDAQVMLLHAHPAHAAAVWQALSDAARRALVAGIAAAPSDGDPPAVHDPIAAFALEALRADDADLRAAGVAALTARPEVTRTIWVRLPSAVQQSLGALPAFADLSTPQEPRAIRRARRR